MRFYDQTPAGALVSRLTNDSQAVADMFGTMFSSFLSFVLIFFVTLATMLSLSWRLTLWILLFLPVIFGSIQLYQKLSVKLVSQTCAKLSELNVKLSESIEGMRIIQAFGQQERLIAEF